MKAASRSPVQGAPWQYFISESRNEELFSPFLEAIYFRLISIGLWFNSSSDTLGIKYELLNTKVTHSKVSSRHEAAYM